MYQFIPLEYNEFGYVKPFPYKRPYPPNFFTRGMLGAYVNKDKSKCIFLDKNTDKVNLEEWPMIPNFSLSVCNILANGQCEEIGGEPLFFTDMNQVSEYIESNY